MDAELKNYLEEIKTGLSELRGDVSKLGGDVSKLGGDVSKLGGRLSELRAETQSGLSELREGLSALREHVNEHVSIECEKVETRLLTEFHKWGSTSDMRTRQAITDTGILGERMLAVEDRVSALERQRRVG